MSEPETKPLPNARVIRALTGDHFIRIAVLDASPLWDGIRRAHPHLERDACACLTELMASTVLLQARTLFSERVQLLLKGAGRAKAVVADSWPDGTIRGVLDLADRPDGPWVAAPGLMQVMRSNPAGQPYIGNLPLVEGPVATQVEAYLLQSEQIGASVTLWCDPATGEAGGLLVEPLPACPPDRLARLVQAIEGLEVVPLWERTPDFLINWISQGEGAEIFAASELFYRCRCSREALLATLTAFPQAQKEHIFDAGDPVEVRCDYCSEVYQVFRSDLSGDQG